MSNLNDVFLRLLTMLAVTSAITAPASAQQPQKPNILAINWNIGAYNRGQMGYHTPNIDRIANEGAIQLMAAILTRAAGK